MIDGFRYGFFGQSDVNPWLSALIVSIFTLIFAGIAIQMLKRGYKLRY
jgi:ABC-2 type transport system permease protein